MNKKVEFGNFRNSSISLTGPFDILPGNLIIHNPDSSTHTFTIFIKTDKKIAYLDRIQLIANETYYNDNNIVISDNARLVIEISNSVESPKKYFSYYIINQNG